MILSDGSYDIPCHLGALLPVVCLSCIVIEWEIVTSTVGSAGCLCDSRQQNVQQLSARVGHLRVLLKEVKGGRGLQVSP